jgi:hypothetical protein
VGAEARAEPVGAVAAATARPRVPMTATSARRSERRLWWVRRLPEEDVSVI